MQFLSAIILSVSGLALASANVHDEERREYIELLNSIPNKLWKAGENARFRGYPLSHTKNLCGVPSESFVDVDENYPKQAHDPSQSIPDSFDSVENWPECAEVIGDIRDQSDCGCCWAFGTSHSASDRLCVGTGGKMKVVLSAEETCFCSEANGCGGGFLSTPWNYFKDHGIVSGGQYNNTGPFADEGFCSDFSLPHCHHHGPQGQDPYPDEGAPGCESQRSPSCPSKCDSSSKAPYNDFKKDRYAFSGSITSFQDEKAIQQAIMNYGPVSTAFTVYTDFANYVSGVYHHVSGGVEGGHAVRIVGWGVDNGVKYWKVANSWNPYWGEKGYFRILRGSDECGIESGSMADSGEGTKWGKYGDL